MRENIIGSLTIWPGLRISKSAGNFHDYSVIKEEECNMFRLKRLGAMPVKYPSKPKLSARTAVQSHWAKEGDELWLWAFARRLVWR
jgi:hypothetical protein